MPEAVSVVRAKHPGRVEGGRKGALRRWGGRRVVRLDSVDPTVAAAIRFLIQADEDAKKVRAAADIDVARNEKAATDSETVTAETEVRRAGVDSAA